MTTLFLILIGVVILYRLHFGIIATAGCRGNNQSVETLIAGGDLLVYARHHHPLVVLEEVVRDLAMEGTILVGQGKLRDEVILRHKVLVGHQVVALLQLGEVIYGE